MATRATSAPAAAVLVEDGAPCPAPASPAAVLAERGSGAYTTALALGGRGIVDWGLHLDRLARWGAGSGGGLHTAVSRGASRRTPRR
jgi:hypothetical protein